MAPTSITPENALARAALWLGALVQYGDVDPDDTTIRLKIDGGAGGSPTVITVNLADDLRAFAALGARSDLFDEEL